ncbi:aminoglycoside phosphotransferase family protein [Streptomyces sp. NPDC018693]|uniref:aminoglycoside phosphotransferase family protein n=1 Tax=unclassified Streptomyces TaxID=2593676 RepID=UPI0037A7C448
MHASQTDTTPALVRRLLHTQHPQWSHLPLHRLASGGTVNAIYRLGSSFTVRLPLLPDSADDLAREAHWLPRLAPLLPLPVPEVMALGEPTAEFPHPWAIHRWLDGEVLTEGTHPHPDRLAHDLATFITAFRDIALPDGPPAYRGTPLTTADTETRTAIEALRHTDEPFDADALLAAWESALATQPWTGHPRWTHSDLMPSNLLSTGPGLTAVLDFSTTGTGDPAIDLIPAWNLLPATTRPTFRTAASPDDATWHRARGWALSMAVTQLPYYRHTNPVISANARYTLTQILNDHTR